MHYQSSGPRNPFSHLATGNNRGTNLVHSNHFEHGGRVELIFYPPKIMPNQCRRTHLYKFGDHFRMDVQDRIQDIVRPNSIMRNDFRYAAMTDVQSAHSAILPNAQGAEVDLRSFADKWTFILVSDNYGSSVVGSRITPTRMLYSGWVVDEPVTRGAYGGGDITNPHAVLIITHHTKLAIERSVDGHIGSRDIVDAVGDYDYLDPITAQNILINPEQLYQQDPHHVSKSIMPSELDHATNYSPEISAVPMVANVSQTRPYVELATDFNNPVAHLGSIVSGLADTITNSSSSARTDLMLGGTVDPKWATFSTMVRPGINYIFDKDINPNHPITLSELEYHYGAALKVHALPRTGAGSDYDVTNPMIPSRRNTFTSLISSALPPMMVAKSISEVRFRYNSWERPRGTARFIAGEPQGLYEWMYMATLYGGGDEAVGAAIQGLEFELNNTLWPIIKGNCHDFDVIVHVSLMGSTLVDLQLYDERGDTGLIETNNMLGGLNSPVIGNISSLSDNVAQLATSMSDMFATGMPSNPYGFTNNHTY